MSDPGKIDPQKEINERYSPKPELMPYLMIEVKGSNDSRSPESLMPAIKVAIPRQISARIARMHVLEYVGKELKKGLTNDAMKVIGLK